MGIGLVSSMVIARLLSPEEIGTFAIASSVVMIMAEFRVLGANSYIIREKALTSEKIRSSYGLTILISWSMGFLIIFSSYPLSIYFDIKGLFLVFLLLSVGFFMAPYISIPHALLSREFKFGVMAKVYICAALTQFIVTVILIYLGFSYFSLAYGMLASVAIRAVMFLYASRDIKVYAPSFKNMRPIAKVGIYTSLGNVLRRTQQTAPDMVIGKMGSPTEVGLFSRGLGFVVFLQDLVISGINPVAAPYLADINNRGESLVQAYTNASQLITGVLWPVLIVASVASLPAVRLMFGEQWDFSAPLASVVALWAIFRSAHVFLPQTLITLGFESAMFSKELIVFPVFLTAIIVGYNSYGLQGVSYGFILAGTIDFLVSYAYLKRYLGLPILEHVMALIPSALTASVCWLAIQGISYIWPFQMTSPFVSFLQILGILPLVWMLALYLFKHPLSDELIKLFGIFKGKIS